MPTVRSIDLDRLPEIRRALDAWLREVFRRFGLRRAYLYGSFARGCPHEGSDIDLVLIGPFRGKMPYRVIDVLGTTDLPVQPLCYTPEEWDRMVESANPLAMEVLASGREIVDDFAAADRRWLEPISVADALLVAERVLSDASVPGGRLVAETLLAYVVGGGRAHLMARSREPLTREHTLRFFGLTTRASRHVPVPYLTGRCEWYGLGWEITPDVLVPRPETEHVVEAALRALPPGPLRIADVGTGSGNIAVTLAYHRRDWMVAATDISPPALRVATENARRHDAPVRLLHADLLTPFAKHSLDAVVSNPPYVAAGAATSPSTRHEPRLALDGGPDGLAVIRRIVRDAPGVLGPGGVLLLEIGYDQADAVRTLLAPRFGEPTFHRDIAGHLRVVEARCR